jgi:hypothetical protein
VEPQYRTADIKQTSMKSITLSQIDGSHSSAAPTVIACVVGLNSLLPEFSGRRIAVLAEANID